MYILYYTTDAKKDFQKIVQSNHKKTCLELLGLIKHDPLQTPPPYKKLKGIYSGMYSRRINLQHRLFCEIDQQNKKVKVLRMWSHYGDN